MTRDTHVQVRISEEEKAQLRERAESLGLSLSEYIRQRALYQQAIGKTPDEVFSAMYPPGPPPEAKPQEISPEERLERRINHYRHVRGFSQKLAEREARRDLGL